MNNYYKINYFLFNKLTLKLHKNGQQSSSELQLLLLLLLLLFKLVDLFFKECLDLTDEYD